MSEHTHADDRATIGCPACIDATRAAEEAARWSEAPLRRCTVHACYAYSNHLSFDIEVAVPTGATTIELEYEYADIIGEQFVLALPDTVAMECTCWALESMEVVRIDVGPLIHPAPAGDPHAGMAPLFATAVPQDGQRQGTDAQGGSDA